MISKEYFDNTPMFGTGGSDMSGEWYWSGNYYCYLYRGEDKCNNNYYIQYWRRGSIRKTLGWVASVQMSLNASNSGEITIAKQIRQRSLKKCKEIIYNTIKHYEGTSGDREIEEWKNKHRAPVFTIENNEPTIVSYTYGYVSQDFNDKGHFSYWKDQKYDYKSGVKYYTVSTYGNKLSLSRNDKTWCGYCSGSSDFDDETKKEIINKVFFMVECNPSYSSFVNKIKELI